MNTFTAIAILVSILGSALILAVVWLVYKYRSKQISADVETPVEPPMRKLVVHRGRVVPASKMPTPSIRSGWSSLRHRSWLLSAPSLPTSDSSIVQQMSNPGSYVPIRSPEQSPTTAWHKQTRPHHDIQTIVESRGPSMEERYNVSPSLLTSSQSSLPSQYKNTSTFFWNGKYPHAATPEEKNTAVRSFLEDPSAESLPAFPRPPYLSPLQSRYHVRRGPSSPLARIDSHDGS